MNNSEKTGRWRQAYLDFIREKGFCFEYSVMHQVIEFSEHLYATNKPNEKLLLWIHQTYTGSSVFDRPPKREPNIVPFESDDDDNQI